MSDDIPVDKAMEEGSGAASAPVEDPVVAPSTSDSAPVANEASVSAESSTGDVEVSKKRKNLSPTSSEDGSDDDGDSTAGPMTDPVDDENQYDMGDGFMVGDEEEDGGGQKRKKSKKVERKRLRRNVDKVVLDEDDLAIMEENRQDEVVDAAVDKVAYVEGEEDGSEGGDDFISPDAQQAGEVPQGDDEMNDFIVDEGSDAEQEPGGDEGARSRVVDAAPVASSRRQASQHFAMGPTPTTTFYGV